MDTSQSNHETMSITDRIDASGQAREFNDAVADRDIETVIVILASVEQEPEVISTVLNDLGFFR